MPPNYEKIGPLSAIRIQGSGKLCIILFHGYGSSAEDLLDLASLDSRFTWVFPQGPLKVAISFFYSGHAWFPINMQKLQIAAQSEDWDSFEKSLSEESSDRRKELQEFLYALHIPLENCILGGFSQGAIVATDLLLHSKERMAGLLLLSAALCHEEKLKPLLATKKATPFFQCHGRQDPLLPFSRAQKLNILLQEAGLKGSLFSFEGGHELSAECITKLTQFLQQFTP